MKEEYKTPTVEVVEVEPADVISTSQEGGDIGAFPLE